MLIFCLSVTSEVINTKATGIRDRSECFSERVIVVWNGLSEESDSTDF